ncbi:MAG: hypothetical protein V8S86_01515 [Eubacteriales bacterium]
MTYNANGGYFDSDTSTTTTEEKVPAQPSYRLNTTAEFKPTHADDNSTKVAFVGWSLDNKDTIYGLDDSYDPSILADTVDVSSENNEPSTPYGAMTPTATANPTCRMSPMASPLLLMEATAPSRPRPAM